MPKKPIEYAKCKIYRIVCKDFAVPSVYVGHTTDMIRRRATHKCSCNNPSHKKHNFKIYQQIRENGGWDNWIMLLVEDYPCSGYEEASARERYWAEQFEADLNSQVPGRSQAEWRQDNREVYLAIKRKYNHKKIMCVCGVETSCGNKTQHLKTKKHLKFISAQSIQTTDAEATPERQEDSTL